MSFTAEGGILNSKHGSYSNLESRRAGKIGWKRQNLATCLLYGLLFILSFAHFIGTFGYTSNQYPTSRQTNATSVTFDWEQELERHSCYPNRQCARFEVPLDYSHPTGEKAVIAVIRIKARVSFRSKYYRGPILFNPGSPGGSGVSMINNMGEIFQKILGDEYDIVRFDPRGVGLTTPAVSVFSDVYERVYWEAGASPLINATSDSFLHRYTRSELFGDLSMKHAAEYVSTETVARDMLAITQAHGRDKLL